MGYYLDQLRHEFATPANAFYDSMQAVRGCLSQKVTDNLESLLSLYKAKAQVTTGEEKWTNLGLRVKWTNQSFY